MRFSCRHVHNKYSGVCKQGVMIIAIRVAKRYPMNALGNLIVQWMLHLPCCRYSESNRASELVSFIYWLACRNSNAEASEVTSTPLFVDRD